MFKNKLYKALVIAVLLLSASSCNKYLDLRPENGITVDKFWQTKEQVRSAVFGIYNGLVVGNGGKAPAENFFTWGEVRADYVIPGPGVTAEENNLVNNNLLPAESTNNVMHWQPMYRVINLCNNLLENAPKVRERDGTFTQDALNGYIGEAYAIRALMYFYLVRSFGDVPLVLKSTATDDDIDYPVKSVAADVFKQIDEDLKLAESNCVSSYGNNASDKGRITKFTVNAMQADVALWRDDFQGCITACDKVIASGKYGLLAGDQGWFSSLYGTGNSPEGIFELQFDNQQLNPYFSLFSPTVRNRYLANPYILDSYFTTDNQNPQNADIRGIDVAIHASDQAIYKYIALGPTSLRTADGSYAHWIVYRYADILLMKAEACIWANRGQETLDLINTIRNRAKALPGSSASPDPSNKDGLTTYLVAERGREFAFEGKRWYDLLRNARRSSFARLDLLITAAGISVPALSQQSAINKLKDPNSLYFPIPKVEIQNNPNLVQNPFYK